MCTSTGRSIRPPPVVYNVTTDPRNAACSAPFIVPSALRACALPRPYSLLPKIAGFARTTLSFTAVVRRPRCYTSRLTSDVPANFFGTTNWISWSCTDTTSAAIPFNNTLPPR